MTVYDNIRDGAYKTKLPYPEEPNNPEKTSIKGMNADQVRELASQIEAYPALLTAFRVKADAYHEDRGRLEGVFREDIEQEYGTNVLPEKVRDALYSKAYEDGHAYGFSEVASKYSGLVELVNIAFQSGKEVLATET